MSDSRIIQKRGKWRASSYKTELPLVRAAGSKLYWKSDGKVSGPRKKDDSFICTYATAGTYSLWVLDWIGLPRQQYKHSKPRCGSASPVPVSNWNYTFPSTTFDLPQYIATLSPLAASFVHIELIIGIRESTSYLSYSSMMNLSLHIIFSSLNNR